MNSKPAIWLRLVNKLDRAREQIRFLKYEKSFGERDSDIYIAGFPRSGTTLLQVIAYHLTHYGGMDYNHLNDVSPWLRVLAIKKLPAPDIVEPRVIKTHDPYTLIPPDKKGRFIFIIRDAADVAVSNYHNWKNYNGGSLQMDEVFEKLIANNSAPGYLNFNRTWLENKKNLPILYLRYEDVVNNKRKAINDVAAFLKIAVSDEQITALQNLSSFENMKLNGARFGEQPVANPDGGKDNQFIRHGKPGEGKAVLTAGQLLYCRKIGEQLYAIRAI
jgi:Sulfotransferase domain